MFNNSKLCWREPYVSQLLSQQTLKVKEHQDCLVFLLGLDEELEVALLIESHCGKIGIDGNEATTGRGIRYTTGLDVVDDFCPDVLTLHVITDSETADFQCRIGRPALGIGDLTGKVVPDFRISKIPVHLVVEQAEISGYLSGIRVFQDIGDSQEFFGKKVALGVPVEVSTKKPFKSASEQSNGFVVSTPGRNFLSLRFIVHQQHTSYELLRSCGRSLPVSLQKGERHSEPPFRSGRHPRHKGRGFL